jgi:glycosyltransferase involved in cell wall biosynthesis
VTRFVCVRRLVPRNGVDVLVKAWRQAGIADRARLVIAGDGPELATLTSLAAGTAGIRFAGRVTHEELVRLFATAHATIVPTRSGEGFGLVAAESLACGTPVIASDQGGLAEVVRHGVDGMLVPAGDPRALSAALRLLADDGALRQRLIQGARGTDWSWDAAGDRLHDVLASVVERQPGSLRRAVGSR